MKNIMILLAVLVYGPGLLANEEWSFHSKWDKFSIVQGGAHYYLGKKKLVTNDMATVYKLFQTDLAFECAKLPKKFDLKITQNQSGEIKERFFYLKSDMMSDGKKCIEVTGQGVYYLPYHRQWFIGDKKVIISLKDKISISARGKQLVDLVQKNGKWMSADSKRFLNWDLFFNFKNAVKSFPITVRAHPEIAKDHNFERSKPSLKLTTNGRTYTFYNVSEKTWLLKLPGKVPWLLMSDNFGVFDTMSRKAWDSPLSDQLSILVDVKSPVDQRVKVVRDHTRNSSKDVRQAFYQVLSDPESHVDVKLAVVKALRGFPSDKNLKELVEALEQTTDYFVLEAITKALRIRNPKGPIINDEDDEKSMQRKMLLWKNWAKKL